MVHIGVSRVTLRVGESHSLKEKRRVVRSLIDRLRARYNAAVIEVESQDSWQTAVLGIAVVSGQSAHAERQLATIVEHIESSRLDAEVVDREIEIVPF